MNWIEIEWEYLTFARAHSNLLFEFSWQKDIRKRWPFRLLWIYPHIANPHCEMSNVQMTNVQLIGFFGFGFLFCYFYRFFDTWKIDKKKMNSPNWNQN